MSKSISPLYSSLTFNGMCVHLGLRDLVANQGENFNRLSTVQPRMLPLPHSAIDREERVRAFWMTEVLDNISTLGAAWNLGVSPPEPSGVLPCSDSIWAFPEHIINVWSFGAFYFSSAFSLCIILATNELWHVHRFLQQSIDIGIEDGKVRWRSEAQQIDERLTTWRGDFVAAVYRLINAEHAQEERAEMDPNIVLTNAILDCAVIVLFQRIGPFPDGVESDDQAWPYATNRCLYACDDLAAKIRLIHDHEIEITSPHLAFSIFVAARFYLVYSRAVDADIPRNLQILAYALHLMARRWPLAKRYETLVRAGVADHRTPVLMSSLPPQFFDLRYSTLDIDETLRLWADNHIAQFGDSTSSVAAMST